MTTYTGQDQSQITNYTSFPSPSPFIVRFLSRIILRFTLTPRLLHPPQLHPPPLLFLFLFLCQLLLFLSLILLLLNVNDSREIPGTDKHTIGMLENSVLDPHLFYQDPEPSTNPTYIPETFKSVVDKYKLLKFFAIKLNKACV